MRIACCIAVAVFGLFSYWQLNDLEQYGTRLWYAWVLAYAAVALVSLVSIRTALPRLVYASGAALALVAGLIRLTDIEWQKQIFYNETNPAGNETGGLLVVACWLAVLAWRVGAGSQGDGAASSSTISSTPS